MQLLSMCKQRINQSSLGGFKNMVCKNNNIYTIIYVGEKI